VVTSHYNTTRENQKEMMRTLRAICYRLKTTGEPNQLCE